MYGNNALPYYQAKSILTTFLTVPQWYIGNILWSNICLTRTPEKIRANEKEKLSKI